MKNDNQNLYISVESLRNKITSRLIPLLSIALFVNLFLSLARMPLMGFRPFMLLHILFGIVGALLFFARKRIGSEISAFVIVAILCFLLVAGVATLGLLSATFILAPIIALYLMMLGYRKSAYLSIAFMLIYVSIMGSLFITGVFESPATPNLYVHSVSAWMVMIVAVGGTSIAFVAPFKLVPGVLEGSERRFHLAFENSNVGMCLISLDGHMLMVNDALCTMMGYTRSELEQRSITELSHPDDKEMSLDVIKRVLINGEGKVTLEKRYAHKNGDVVWANVSSSLIRNGEGEPEYYITHIQNITERKRVQDELTTKEETYRTVFENTGTATVLIEADTTISLANAGFEKLSQYSRQEIEGKKSWTDFVVKEDLDRMMIQHRLKRENRELALKGYEFTFVRRDGEKRNILLTNETIPGTQRSISSLLDITERKRTEAALQASEERFRQLAEIFPETIFEADLFGTLTYANTHGLQLFGVDETAVRQGVNIMSFVYPEQRQVVQQRIQERIAGKAGGFLEYKALRGDGTNFDAMAYSAPILTNGHVSGIRGFILDITERKKVEEHAKQLTNHLQVTLDTVTVGISHIKNRKIEWANAAHDEIFGYPIGGTLGRETSSFYVEREIFDRLGQDAYQQLADGRSFTTEAEMFKKDGSRIWCGLSGRYVNPSEPSEGSIWMVQNITGRRASEQALRESEGRLQAMFDASRDAIGVSKRGIHIYANPSYLKLFGFETNGAIAGTSILNSIAPDYRKQMMENVQRRYAGQSVPKLYEARGLRTDGTEFDAEFSVSTYELNGEIYSVAVIRDITERKKAEVSLRESEERFRTIYENSSIGLYRTTPDGSIILANSTLVKKLGFSSFEELAERNLAKGGFETSYERKHFIEEIEEEGEVKGLEAAWTRKDGSTIHVRESARVIRDANGKVLYYDGSVEDITERKQAEEALLKSEERMRAIVEGTPHLFFYTQDAEANSTYVSPTVEQITGYKAETWLKRKDWFMTGAKSNQSAKERTHAHLQGKITSEPTFVEVRHANGNPILLEAYEYPVMDNGVVIGLQGVAHDVTERKHSEEALRESEKRFRQLAEAAVEGIAFTENGIFVDGNARLAGMLGYELSEMVGRPVGDFIAPESRALVLDRIRQNYEIPYEHYLLRKDGSIFPVESHARMMLWKNALMRVTSLLDISERRRTQIQLHKLSLAVEQSPASIVITDTRGNIEYINPTFTRITGYTLEEAVGRNPRILKSGETSPEEYKKLWDTISSGKDWRGEFHNKKKNGELYWELASISPVKNTEGVITNFVAVKEDITDRKRSEEALRHAQKLESIGTLAGGIAHDFNNLLNAILGQSTLAISKLTKENPAKDHIEKSLKAAERAADLTRHLLAYSGKGKLVTEEIDLNSLVSENSQILEVSVPKTVQLRFDLGSPSAYISGDIGQIQQIIMNLIINAGEAIYPNPGTITVHTRQIQLTENDLKYTRFTNNSLPSGNYASLAVDDTGHGMNPQVMARIFDPFFSTKFTGRGLGLAAVLGIIKGHHGGLRIESEVGKGTSFEVVFPLINPSLSPEARAMKVMPTLNGEGKSILVIDDETSILELLRDVFSDANFKVLEAANPVDGINLYRRHQHRTALVVLDYSMPGMDGKKAFDELVAINKGVRVILCSGYAEEEMKSAFGDVLPMAFLKKPYKPAELLERVSSILDKRG